MEPDKLNEFIDHQRWLMDNGLFNDAAKDTLYMYGALVHNDISAVHVKIDRDTKTISYELYAQAAFLKKINAYQKLRKSTTLWDLWQFKRLLKKTGNLDFKPILKQFVTDFCGPKWKVQLKIDDVVNFVDEPTNEERVDISKGTD